MKKYSLILFAVTVTCIVVGLAYNLKGFPLSGNSESDDLIEDEADFGNVDVKEINVDMESGRVSFEYGSKLEVSSVFPKDQIPVVTYEDGILSVKQNRRKIVAWKINIHNDKYATKITIPEGTVVSNLTVNNDLGNIDVSGDYSNVDLKLGLGKATLTGNFDNVKVENENGNVELNAKGEKAVSNVDMKLELGKAMLTGSFDNVKVVNTNGNVELNADSEKVVSNVDMMLELGNATLTGNFDRMNVENKNGSIEVNTDGELDLNKVSLHSKLGNVIVNGKKID